KKRAAEGCLRARLRALRRPSRVNCSATWTECSRRRRSTRSTRGCGVFAGMHGDEMGEGEEEEGEEEAEFEEESTPSDWSPPVDSQFTPELRACPDEVLEGLAKKDHIVVWFSAPENAWFEGQVTGILKKGVPGAVRTIQHNGRVELGLAQVEGLILTVAARPRR
ncbi:hypothetical protein T492DRAFT_1115598, partial [Pavlovales sp. CCMP2436]